MKKAVYFLSLNLLTTFCFGQINENFNSGIPGNWTQWSTSGITWTGNSTLGVNSSGCAIADYSSNSNAGTAWLQTPFMNLSTLSSPEINFSVALVGNNTNPPDVLLWYDNGGGWTQLNSWGSGITQTFDNNPPLDAGNVTWVNLNYSLSSLANNTSIRFSFGSDFTNGGWVLVDDVVIQSGPAPTVYTLPYFQDFEGTNFLPQDWEAFGSNTNAAWQQSTNIGAYGNSSRCAFFDNITTNLTGSFYGMRSVLLDLTNATTPTLTFDVAYARFSAQNSDRLGIWYALNGTNNWVNLVNFQDGTLTTAPDQTTYFTPANSQWDSITVNLSQFSGQSSIRFAFENNSDNGNILYVDNVHFYDNNTTSINSITTDFSIQIFPNPTTGIFKITFSDQKTHYIELYSLAGVRVLAKKLKDGNILDIEYLKSGIYFMKIDNGSTMKVIKE
jgi:hypothetical protein